LRIVPPCISDDPIDTRTERGKRGRKPAKIRLNKLLFCFSGTTLLSPLEKGHLLLKCDDGCFEDVKLKDIKGCNFPGAVGKEPVTTLWSAWLAASIFMMRDLDLEEKIKFHREGAVCFDSEALGAVPKMAYNKCVDWTEFICTTKKIVQHSPIEGNYFESSYDDALQAVRRELKKEEDRGKREKSGPIGYIAGEGSIGLERDGMRGEILTRMVTNFERMLFVLEEWSSFRAWEITSPLDDKIDEEKSKKLLQLVKSQIDNGGKVITVWPAVNERNSSKWKGLFELWKTLDEALSRLDYGNRVLQLLDEFLFMAEYLRCCVRNTDSYHFAARI
ncbi:hypothetical protein OESDEN_12368, partial [Oesophagostomum dentatum]